MSPAFFIITITCYLISIVTALVLAIFSRLVSIWVVRILVAVHAVLFIAWLAADNEGTIDQPALSNYLFLTFILTGLLLAGTTIRKPYSVVVKIYFSLFLLTLPVFIVSPSRVIGFIASGNPHAIDPKRYHLSENYYFVEQNYSNESSIDPKFKLIREMGAFHKTMARDIQLPPCDSIHLIELKENEFIMFEIFSSGTGRVVTEKISQRQKPSTGIIRKTK